MVPSAFRISQITPTGGRPASRARSTLASVCPTRRSTPPGTARRGKTCPGRRRSSGRVASSVMMRIVMARSAALIPVVTPKLRAASTDTVKAVPWGSVFTSVMGRSPSASARSPVRVTQMRPRPCTVMKFTSSGVMAEAAQTRSPSFSRSSSSATMTILPSRMSWRASSTRSKGMASFPGDAAPRESRRAVLFVVMERRLGEPPRGAGLRVRRCGSPSSGPHTCRAGPPRRSSTPRERRGRGSSGPRCGE
jgi:hypothetical protein